MSRTHAAPLSTPPAADAERRPLLVRRVVLITAAVAVPAFALGPILMPPAAGSPEPTGIQIALFMLLGVFESVTMGLAVAFLVSAGKIAEALPARSRAQARAACYASAWLLGSWWVHDGLHRVNGSDLAGLLAIEYGFHVTLMACAVIVVWFLAGQRPADHASAASMPASAR